MALDIYGKDTIYDKHWGQSSPWQDLMHRSRASDIVDYDDYGNPLTSGDIATQKWAGMGMLASESDLGNRLRGGQRSYEYSADNIDMLEKSLVQKAKANYEYHKKKAEEKDEKYMIGGNPSGLAKSFLEGGMYDTFDKYLEGHGILKAAKEGTLDWDDNYGLMIPTDDGSIPLAYNADFEGGLYDYSPNAAYEGVYSFSPGDKKSQYAKDTQQAFLPGFEAGERKEDNVIDGEKVTETLNLFKYGGDSARFGYDYGDIGLERIFPNMPELSIKGMGKKIGDALSPTISAIKTGKSADKYAHSMIDLIMHHGKEIDDYEESENWWENSSADEHDAKVSQQNEFSENIASSTNMKVNWDKAMELNPELVDDLKELKELSEGGYDDPEEFERHMAGKLVDGSFKGAKDWIDFSYEKDYDTAKSIQHGASRVKDLKKKAIDKHIEARGDAPNFVNRFIANLMYNIKGGEI
tara:strand:+ start:4779 stop:6176 length:1398 start_codon:yes stop_codon:yes gene_type:complete